MEMFFDSLLSFDLSVFEWIQDIQNGFLDALMVSVTTLGNAGAVFIVLGFALLFTKKYRKAGLAVLVALIVMLLCSDLFLKEFFARPRPFNLFDSNPEKYAEWGAKYIFPELVYKPSSYSFPSGHTASAFAAATALLWHSRKWGIPTMIFAAVMGFSRIYVQVHYCTDVFGGIVAGAICGLIAVLIVRFLFPAVDKGLDKLSAKLKKKKA
ncbi:MAG: phosphatase PAP2 family protein [Clostridia bacterium]|nr:phosphatase PAP2 family protein [Clostridia bacterium]